MTPPPPPQNWRAKIDTNLKRLRSLTLRIDSSINNEDYVAAQTLCLQLLGFLDSQTIDEIDVAYISPIRKEVVSKLDMVRRALVPGFDRQAFFQAKREPGTVFIKRGDIDIEKVKQSKFFKAFLPKQQATAVSTPIPRHSIQSQSNSLQLDGSNSRSSCKAPKVMTQTTITSLYGSKLPKPSTISNANVSNFHINSSKERTVTEYTPSYNQIKGHNVFTSVQIDEVEKPHGNHFGAKRAHTVSVAPVNEDVNSPQNNEETDVSGSGFVTARAKLELDARQRRGLTRSPAASVSPQSDNSNRAYGIRSGGFLRRPVRSNFVPPIKSNGSNSNTGHTTSRNSGKNDDGVEDSTKRCLELLCGPDGELPVKLRNLEPRIIEHVSNEIMDKDPDVRWDDIAGLAHAKKCVTEMVIWPLLRPDIFKGCRSPGKGLLLFGPPGTGKTMIGKAIAGEAKATFFYISASSLTSKWIGEGEKLVRALFAVACCRQPAVIFVDEIDSLLSQRKSDGEHESSRRLKTQFLIEMEGFDSGTEQVLLIGATNRPQELDEAARRRLTKRLYIPLPDSGARAWIISNILKKNGLLKLSIEDIDWICKSTEGYSGSDMHNLVKEAAMGPVRDAQVGVSIMELNSNNMRPVTIEDFQNALQEVRPSVSANELHSYEEWNMQFGSLKPEKKYIARNG